jgi:hypothetical protein
MMFLLQDGGGAPSIVVFCSTLPVQQRNFEVLKDDGTSTLDFGAVKKVGGLD